MLTRAAAIESGDPALAPFLGFLALGTWPSTPSGSKPCDLVSGNAFRHGSAVSMSIWMSHWRGAMHEWRQAAGRGRLDPVRSPGLP